MEPLVIAKDARIELSGRAIYPSLSFAAEGPHVGLVGETAPLVSLLSGTPPNLHHVSQAALRHEHVDYGPIAELSAGSLEVRGRSVLSRPPVVHVPCDPPLPLDWTVLQLVRTWADAHAPSGAEARTMAALKRTGAFDYRAVLLSRLAVPELRAASIAAALATGKELLLIETPLAGLQGAGAQFVMGALFGAIADRFGIVTFHAPPSDDEAILLRQMSSMVVLSGGRAILEGPPHDVLARAPSIRVELRVPDPSFALRLSERGLVAAGGPTHFVVSGEGHAIATEVARTAHACGCQVVEIAPLM